MAGNLKPYDTGDRVEAGCDEAGRGCLAGPVFAAAVILPKDFYHPLLDDSKKLKEKVRLELREYIIRNAECYAVSSVSPQVIDEINILWASVLAMHQALEKLPRQPQLILVDGNRFKPYGSVPYRCYIRGDSRFASIAAASILAKTSRDEYMKSIHSEYPAYGWSQNKGYPSRFHRMAVLEHGLSPHHRKSFHVHEQLALPFG